MSQLVPIDSPALPALVPPLASAPRSASSNSSPANIRNPNTRRAYARAADLRALRQWPAFSSSGEIGDGFCFRDWWMPGTPPDDMGPSITVSITVLSVKPVKFGKIFALASAWHRFLVELMLSRANSFSRRGLPTSPAKRPREISSGESSPP